MPRVKSIKPKVPKSYNTDHAQLLLQSLQIFFFQNKNFLVQLYDIIENNNEINPALMDFFITNYSKTNISCIKLSNNDYFYIYDEYKNQLKSHTKKLFDPFKRSSKFIPKIEFEYENIKIVTTIAQLNFYKWILKYNILKYIEENKKDICNSMSVYLENKKQKKKN